MIAGPVWPELRRKLDTPLLYELALVRNFCAAEPRNCTSENRPAQSQTVTQPRSDVQKRCLPSRAAAGPDVAQGPESGWTVSGTDSTARKPGLNLHGAVRGLPAPRPRAQRHALISGQLNGNQLGLGTARAYQATAN